MWGAESHGHMPQPGLPVTDSPLTFLNLEEHSGPLRASAGSIMASMCVPDSNPRAARTSSLAPGCNRR